MMLVMNYLIKLIRSISECFTRDQKIHYISACHICYHIKWWDAISEFLKQPLDYQKLVGNMNNVVCNTHTQTHADTQTEGQG